MFLSFKNERLLKHLNYFYVLLTSRNLIIWEMSYVIFQTIFFLSFHSLWNCPISQERTWSFLSTNGFSSYFSLKIFQEEPWHFNSALYLIMSDCTHIFYLSVKKPSVLSNGDVCIVVGNYCSLLSHGPCLSSTFISLTFWVPSGTHFH